MRRVLLVTDLEGITGVDDADALVFGAPGHEAARARMTEEAVFACRELLAAGWDEVRLVDSHLSGSGDTNLFVDALPAGVEAFFAEAPFAEPLFDGCEAVAALGFHAAARRPGFAAHTVNLHTAWRQGTRWLSELDLLLGVAGAWGTKVLFATGDDVLQKDTRGTRFVCTKTARSTLRAKSRGARAVQRELRAACRAAGRAPKPAPKTPLELHFRSTWMADVAQASGAKRVAPLVASVRGGDFPTRLGNALDTAARAELSLASSLRGAPGEPAFLEDVRSLLLAPYEARAVRLGWRDVERTTKAFLRLTEGATENARVLRALGLFMLRHLAPRAFRRLKLTRIATAAHAALRDVPLALDASLDADAAQGRVDAWWLRRAAGEDVRIDDESLARTVLSLRARGDEVYAWLLEGLSSTGRGADAPVAPRLAEPLLDTYALTHRFLLEARYGQRKLPGIDAAAVERLHRAVPWVLEAKHVDLGGEVALCLLLTGERATPDAQALLQLLERAQRKDGAVWDASLGMPAAELADHTTLVAMLCFALSASS